MEDYLIIGLVLILIVGLSMVEQLGPKPEKLLPETIEGFTRIGKYDHVAPVFEGEKYSSHSFYKPAKESEFANNIGRLTITIYLFANSQRCQKAKNILLKTFQEDSTSEKLQANQIKTKIYSIPGQNKAETLWCQNRLLYQISTASKENQYNQQALTQVITQAIKVTMQQTEL